MIALVVSLAGAAWAQGGGAQSGGHVGLVSDWTHRHLVASKGLSPRGINLARVEPRLIPTLLQRNQNLSSGGRGATASPGIDGSPQTPRQKNRLQVDWAVSLGSGAVAANMSPAKYGFDVNGAPDCTNDYAVFALNVAGVTGGQANVVAFNNLYTGTTPVNGICGTGNPSFLFSYNGSTAGGKVLTSPIISLDGKRIAYVESAAGSAIFHVLIWKSGEGSSSTNAVAPTQTGSCTIGSSCLKSLTYSASASNSISSPWYDYHTDKIYVGSDDGKIYRIGCVFSCPLNTNPSVDWTYTLPVAGTGGANAVPTAPVLEASSGLLIVGDSLGELWSINATGASPSLAAGPIMVGGGGCTTTNPPGRTGTPAPCTANGSSFGIVDPVLLDGSTSRVFAFSGNDGQTAGITTTSAAVVQATTMLGSVVRAHVGRGSRANTTTNADIHAGAFDNNYWGGSPSSGLLFVCGTATGSTAPWHWKIGFTSYPTMNSSATAIVARGFNNGNPCTPYTEIYNPNIDFNSPNGHHDLLISGVAVPAGTGYVITNDISTGTVTAALATNTRPTGTSAFVIDNYSTSGQASSLYFTTLVPDTSGACNGVICAVKLTQAALQ